LAQGKLNGVDQSAVVSDESRQDRVSSGFDIVVDILKVLKEASGMAPVPFLKGALGTALVLFETAQVHL